MTGSMFDVAVSRSGRCCVKYTTAARYEIFCYKLPQKIEKGSQFSGGNEKDVSERYIQTSAVQILFAFLTLLGLVASL
jgi:hypothetical protein